MDIISPNQLPIGGPEKSDVLHLDDISGTIPTLHEVIPNYDTPLHHTAVAARLFSQLTPQQQDEEAIVHMRESKSLYPNTVLITLPINRLPTLGLILYDDVTIDHPILRTCQEGTHAYRIPNWRSRIKGSVILRINDKITRNKRQDHPQYYRCGTNPCTTT